MTTGALTARASRSERRCACGGKVGPSGECAACRAKRLARERGRFAPPIVHDVLRSPGRPLEPITRRLMEARLGHDFASVRVHDDSRAAASAEAVGAEAYAVGRDVVFGAGQFRPASRRGHALLAHELAHVAQQGGPATAPILMGAANAPEERDAVTAAWRGSRPRATGGPVVLRRQLASGSYSPMGPSPGWGPVEIERWKQLVTGFVTSLPEAVLAAAKSSLRYAARLASAADPRAYSCVSGLEPDLYQATYGAPDPGGNGGFRRWYYDQTKKPVPNPVYDAFGHCYIACRGARDCGLGATAVSGKGREFGREYLFGGPHDSYEQDTNNQTIGRGFGEPGANCYDLCRDAASTGKLDLSAPVNFRWTPTEAPAEVKERGPSAGPLPPIPEYKGEGSGWR